MKKILLVLLLISSTLLASDLPSFVDGTSLPASDLNALVSGRTGHLRPISSSSLSYESTLWDLGSTSYYWRNLYLSGTANVGSGLVVDTSTLVVDPVNNRVGIGTTTPAKPIEIKDTNNNNTAQLKLRDFTSSTSFSYLGTFSDSLYLTSGGTYSSGWASDSATKAISGIVLSSASGDSTISFQTTNTNNTGPTTYGRISNIGEFFIGDRATTGRLASGTGEVQTRREGSNSKIRIQTVGSGYQGYLAFDSARGTFASPTALQAGDTFGSVIGVGAYDSSGTAFGHGPEILFRTTQAWTGSAYGSKIIFLTVPDNSTSQVNAMILLGNTVELSLPTYVAASAGNTFIVNTNDLVVDSTNHRVGIGTTTPSQALDVVGGIKSSTIVTANGGIDAGAGLALKFKRISIGDWNMDTTETITVNHGLSDLTKIRRINAVILRDDSLVISELERPNVTAGTFYDHAGGIGDVTSTNVTLYRSVAGAFDNTNYDATSFNRGYILIWYEP